MRNTLKTKKWISSEKTNTLYLIDQSLLLFGQKLNERLFRNVELIHTEMGGYCGSMDHLIIL